MQGLGRKSFKPDSPIDDAIAMMEAGRVEDAVSLCNEMLTTAELSTERVEPVLALALEYGLTTEHREWYELVTERGINVEPQLVPGWSEAAVNASADGNLVFPLSSVWDRGFSTPGWKKLNRVRAVEIGSDGILIRRRFKDLFVRWEEIATTRLINRRYADAIGYSVVYRNLRLVRLFDSRGNSIFEIDVSTSVPEFRSPGSLLDALRRRFPDMEESFEESKSLKGSESVFWLVIGICLVVAIAIRFSGI